MKHESPSSIRKTTVQIPDVKWQDIMVNQLIEMVQYPIEYPEIYAKYGQFHQLLVYFNIEQIIHNHSQLRTLMVQNGI